MEEIAFTSVEFSNFFQKGGRTPITPAPLLLFISNLGSDDRDEQTSKAGHDELARVHDWAEGAEGTSWKGWGKADWLEWLRCSVQNADHDCDKPFEEHEVRQSWPWREKPHSANKSARAIINSWWEGPELDGKFALHLWYLVQMYLNGMLERVV